MTDAPARPFHTLAHDLLLRRRKETGIWHDAACVDAVAWVMSELAAEAEREADALEKQGWRRDHPLVQYLRAQRP